MKRKATFERVEKEDPCEPPKLHGIEWFDELDELHVSCKSEENPDHPHDLEYLKDKFKTFIAMADKVSTIPLEVGPLAYYNSVVEECKYHAGYQYRHGSEAQQRAAPRIENRYQDWQAALKDRIYDSTERSHRIRLENDIEVELIHTYNCAQKTQDKLDVMLAGNPALRRARDHCLKLVAYFQTMKDLGQGPLMYSYAMESLGSGKQDVRGKAISLHINSLKLARWGICRQNDDLDD